MTIATYDIGTTAVKGVLINEKGEVLSSESKTISTIFDNEKKEQRPQESQSGEVQPASAGTEGSEKRNSRRRRRRPRGGSGPRSEQPQE